MTFTGSTQPKGKYFTNGTWEQNQSLAMCSTVSLDYTKSPNRSVSIRVTTEHMSAVASTKLVAINEPIYWTPLM